jgi:hypothetical protein
LKTSQRFDGGVEKEKEEEHAVLIVVQLAVVRGIAFAADLMKAFQERVELIEVLQTWTPPACPAIGGECNMGIHRFKTATMAVLNHSILYAAAFMPNAKKMTEKSDDLGGPVDECSMARIVPNRVGTQPIQPTKDWAETGNAPRCDFTLDDAGWRSYPPKEFTGA